MPRYRTKQDWQQSPAYMELKARIATAQGGVCRDCRTPGPLDLHHVVYPQEAFAHDDEVPGARTWGEERDDEVVCLCRDCHVARHRDENGDYWASEAEKAEHWGWFESLLSKDD